MKDTRTIQTLASVSLIGAPLSIIIGGVLLSTASLVCGIVALVSIRKNTRQDGPTTSDAIMQALTRQAIIGIALSAIAVVMNAAAVITMFPAVMEAARTGDFSALLGGDSGAGESSGSTGSGGAFGGNSGDAGPEAPQGERSSVWG